MKTSTFLTLSTSVLVGVLDVSFATAPPPRDYHSSSSSRGASSYPSKAYVYNFPTKTSAIPEHPKYTETPRPVNEHPYSLPPNFDPEKAKTDPELAKFIETINEELAQDEEHFSSEEAKNYLAKLDPDTGLPDDFTDYLENLDIPDDIKDPLPIPDTEIADYLKDIDIPEDLSEPYPLPRPQNQPSEGGFYYGPDGNKIAVAIRPPGFGENPIDRVPHPPPPFPGDDVYGDGVKNTSPYPSQIDPKDPLVEAESALTESDVTGEDPSKAVHKRHLKDLTDDVLADLRNGYDSLKDDFNNIDLPDFSDLFRKYLPSDIGFNVDLENDYSIPIDFPRFPKEQDIDGTVIIDVEPPTPNWNGEPPKIEWHPKWHSHVRASGYEYRTSVEPSKPAQTTFATVTRSAGTAYPTGYSFTLPK